jgi:hypothetical protein
VAVPGAKVVLLALIRGSSREAIKEFTDAGLEHTASKVFDVQQTAKARATDRADTAAHDTERMLYGLTLRIMMNHGLLGRPQPGGATPRIHPYFSAAPHTSGDFVRPDGSLIPDQQMTPEQQISFANWKKSTQVGSVFSETKSSITGSFRDAFKFFR